MTRDVRSPARIGCSVVGIVMMVLSVARRRRVPGLAVLGLVVALFIGASAAEAQTLMRGDVVVSDSGLLIRIDPVSGVQTPIGPPPESGCCGVITFDGNGDILAIAGGPPRVLKIEVPSLAVSTVSSGQLFVAPNSITVAGNGDILLTDHGALRVIRIDPVTGVQTLVSAGGFFSQPTGIVVDAAGQIFVADANAFGGGGGVIRIDPASGAQVVVASGGNFAFNPSNFQSSDPTGLALAANGDLLVADTRGVAHQGGLPEGRHLLTATADALAKPALELWDVQSGSVQHSLEGHTGGIFAGCFSPDGRWCASGSTDGTVRIWSVRDGSLGAVFPVRGSVARLCWGFANRIHVVLFDGTEFELVLRGTSVDPLITTASRQWSAGEEAWSVSLMAVCAYCGARFPPSPEIVAVIETIADSVDETRSPCLDLPAEAWTEPALLSSCPECHTPLRFNPFTGGPGDMAALPV